MPSESSASPMRTIGILCWRSIASSSWSGETIWLVTRMSPIFLPRISSCRSIASVTCSQVAWCCSTSSSPIFGPSSKLSKALLGTNIRLTLPSAGSSLHGGNRNRPKSVSTWPIVCPFISPPSMRWTTYGLAWRWLSSSACGSVSGSGNGRSGVVRVSALNWSKRSGTVVRAGGICRWATEVSGTKKVRRPEVILKSAPVTTWHGKVSVCSLATG